MDSIADRQPGQGFKEIFLAKLGRKKYPAKVISSTIQPSVNLKENILRFVRLFPRESV